MIPKAFGRLFTLLIIFVVFGSIVNSLYVHLTGVDELLHVLPVISDINPNYLIILGISICAGMSILGAATGIFTIAGSLIGMGVMKPHVKTKNLISVIFCEATGIYGLITAIVMCGYIDSNTDFQSKEHVISEQYKAYLIFGAGLSVGVVNLITGSATGIIGSATALADGARPETFVKNLVVEIFSSAISLFGLIVGVYMISRVGSKSS